jgi:hypothetical protein
LCVRMIVCVYVGMYAFLCNSQCSAQISIVYCNL